LPLECRAWRGDYLRIMKSLAIAAISILASVQLCSADLFGKFIGTWNQNGTGAGTRITTVYKRYETKGMIATTTYVIPGIAKSVGVIRYYDNGKIKGDLRRDGTVQTKRIGTWSVSGQTLKAKMKVSARLGSVFTENVTSTLVTTNQIKTVSTSSNGVRSSSAMTRK
jgi:hypothetical protein